MPIKGRSGQYVDFDKKKNNAQLKKNLHLSMVKTIDGRINDYNFDVDVKSYGKKGGYKVDVTLTDNRLGYKPYKEIKYFKDEESAIDFFNRWDFVKEDIEKSLINSNFEFSVINDYMQNITSYNSFDDLKKLVENVNSGKSRGIGSTSTSGTGK